MVNDCVVGYIVCIYLIYILDSPFSVFFILQNGINVMQVSHVEALEHVSPIFKDFGFCPTGEGIDVRNLYRSFCTA